MIEAIQMEIVQRKGYTEEKIDTIYFGGGTPSYIETCSIHHIIDTIAQHFNINDSAEITIEANPDDLDKSKLNELKNIGVNRLSIGLQSLDDRFLRFMNRSHTASQGIYCIKTAQDIGITNISADLIYGIQESTTESFSKDLNGIIELNIPHISCYCLTIEPNTVFGKWNQSKKLKDVNEEMAIEQFQMLYKELIACGYDHYEIANFALEGYISQHNSNYWKGTSYLGIGPGAHSFDGDHNRRVNVANNPKYIKQVMAGNTYFDIEKLTQRDHINEYIMTSLRTKWGCDLNHLKNRFNYNLVDEQGDYLNKIINNDWIKIRNEIVSLTNSGKLFADQIASELFI